MSLDIWVRRPLLASTGFSKYQAERDTNEIQKNIGPLKMVVKNDRLQPFGYEGEQNRPCRVDGPQLFRLRAGRKYCGCNAKHQDVTSGMKAVTESAANDESSGQD